VNNYRHSKKRLAYLLAMLTTILYSMFSGDKDTQIGSFIVFTIWILAFESWRKDV